MFLAAKIARLLRIPHVHTFHTNYFGLHSNSPIFGGLNSLLYLKFAANFLEKIRPDKPNLQITKEKSNANFFLRQDERSLAKIMAKIDYATSPAKFMVDAINCATAGQFRKKFFAEF